MGKKRPILALRNYAMAPDSIDHSGGHNNYSVQIVGTLCTRIT